MTVDLEEEVRDFLFVPEERDFREKELKEEGLKVEGSTVIGISSSSEGGVEWRGVEQGNIYINWGGDGVKDNNIGNIIINIVLHSIVLGVMVDFSYYCAYESKVVSYIAKIDYLGCFASQFPPFVY